MNERQKWFEGKRFGVFTHYLATPAGNSAKSIVTAQEWNERIDNFNVKALAAQIKETGADYFCITIGQNSGHYCSPNATYDSLTGIEPSKCSKRDLVMELAQELSKYGIDAWVYLPSGAPCIEPQAMGKLQWENGQWSKNDEPNHCKRLEDFQRKWESIIREWSLRWGDKVKGWWIDGCYFPEAMYLHDDEPNYHSFARALRAGNENAVLCFNKGLQEPFLIQSEEDDYTAGEVGDALPIVTTSGNRADALVKNLGNKKLHVLSYLGDTWGEGEPRLPDDLVSSYSKYIYDIGGLITWDTRTNLDGTIPDSFMKQLKAISAAFQ